MGTYTFSCSSKNLNTLGRLSKIDLRRDWNPLTRLRAVRIDSGSRGGLRRMSLSWISMSPSTLVDQLERRNEVEQSLLAGVYQSCETSS